MKRSADRILTTHCGSLARPHDLLDMLKASATGEPSEPDTYARRVRSAVAEAVRQQVESSIDIPTDGEQGKTGFSAYASERLTGLTPRPGARATPFATEVAAFPEYYEQYFSHAMYGGAVVPVVPLVCTGPVNYRGQEAVQRDIDNLKAALEGVRYEDAFLPAVAPRGGLNEYYRSEEAYLYAVAEAMHTEYRAIIDAGFILQVDDPFLTQVFGDGALSATARRKRAEMYVEALNHGLRGISPDKVRYHTCYGINEGPRVHDAPLAELVDVMLKVNAGAYSFEAANPRHEHEYHVWEHVRLPDGKVLIPGVITHASNIVEHPELIAERIIRYARLVGRENVIAGTDCGFSSQATYHPEVHPTVVWAKFKSMAEGARLATAELWRGRPSRPPGG
ncbi:MAG: cobalamin-independent methionine synthase II family protein [Candidatus Rokuibacteriota bacterium]